MQKSLRSRILVVAITVVSIYILALFSDQYFLNPFFDTNIALDFRRYVSIFLEQIKSMAIASAAILYFVEASDRKKQKHYQAWQIIESAYAAKTNKNNALVEALEYLASESVSLRGLNLYHPERKKKLDLRGINLKNSDLEGADLRNIDFSGADLSEARLAGVNFTECYLRNTDLRQADLIGANLCNCDLTDATLNNVKLTDDHRTASLRGVILRDRDLVAANLNEKNLSGINLEKADLRGTNLAGFDLSNTYFEEANLADSNLSMTNLKGALITGANLGGANLSQADLTFIYLNDEDIQAKDFNDSYDPEYEEQMEIAEAQYFSNMSYEEYEDRAIEYHQRRLPSFCDAILEGAKVWKGQLSNLSDLDLCLSDSQIKQCHVIEYPDDTAK